MSDFQSNTPKVEFPAEAVVKFIQSLEQRGISIWIDGGWAVDALLEQQTRRNPRLQITPAMKRELLERYLEKKLLLAEAGRRRLGEHIG